MPTVIVNRDLLFEYIGQKYTDDHFTNICFEFGIELDEITSEKEMFEHEQKKVQQGLSTDVLYKIEVPANRYDLLCIEGLALSLRVFLEKSPMPRFRLSQPQDVCKLIVEDSVAKVRPIAVGAILRNIKFTDTNLISFMELQDKLHHNICRQRSLASMGTHDLDTVKGPIYYKALKPEEIKFVPLGKTDVVDGNQLMTNLKSDPKLKYFVHLLENEPLFPVVLDADGKVMSLPPMINSDHSKLTINTRNVFIEVTAKDHTKANIVLNTLVAMFSVYCEEKFTIEPVEVHSNGEKNIFPKIEPKIFTADLKYLNNLAGINIGVDQVNVLLAKMGLESKTINENKIEVSAPTTRSDVLHPCDIAEDLAIAYGYNNITKMKPQTVCHGFQQPHNKLTDLIRSEMAMGGYVECLTMALLSGKDMFTSMNEPINEENLKKSVQISYSKTKEIEFFRNSLIPGILKTIEANKAIQLPFKVFEVSDVAQIDNKDETGAINRRKLCFAYTDTTSGLEILQGMIDKLMQKLRVLFISTSTKNLSYHIENSNEHMFFEDRQANIILDGINVGIFGIVHPKILKNFGIKHPISLVEIDIEHIFNLIGDGKLLQAAY